LYPNDLVYIETNKESYWGYYIKTGRASGQIVIENHDKSQNPFVLSISSCRTIKKFNIDPLGKINNVKKEVRCGMEKPVYKQTS